jgi:hypothetical protein
MKVPVRHLGTLSPSPELWREFPLKSVVEIAV